MTFKDLQEQRWNCSSELWPRIWLYGHRWSFISNIRVCCDPTNPLTKSGFIL